MLVKRHVISTCSSRVIMYIALCSNAKRVLKMRTCIAIPTDEFRSNTYHTSIHFFPFQRNRVYTYLRFIIRGEKGGKGNGRRGERKARTLKMREGWKKKNCRKMLNTNERKKYMVSFWASNNGGMDGGGFFPSNALNGFLEIHEQVDAQLRVL